MNLWEKSLSPGMTSEDSIRSTSWKSHAETLPSPRSRSLGTPGATPGGNVDFEIRKKLGAGGMGVVYTAHQTSIDRDVALKMVKPGLSESTLASEALMSEAVVTGCLDHPNVVPVYDLGVDDKGCVVYAMKKVEGFPWSVLIAEKTLDENLDILVRVADTVAFAHSKGILHRDLKPQNIMLGSFGEIMVMDWGAACTLDGANVVGLLPSDTTYCGTPAYMAPEMAKADKNRFGEASDVYLLGAILYHILTGRPPRREKDPLICLAAAARNQIDPVEDDGELLRIALKAMAAAPADRFQTAAAFQQAIRECRSHSESLLLLASAKVSLGQAMEAGDYDLFNRAIYGFREALTLWTDNPDAQSLLSSATLDYAGCAMERHDYELAQSLLDSTMPEHTGLLQKIGKAIRERDSRENRVRRLLLTARILLAFITILSIAGFFLIRAEQRQTEAQRKRASGEHRKSLINLVSAHYGNRNYESAVSSFWNLTDLYGTNGLPKQTLHTARIASAMNPYKGWLSHTNGSRQTLRVGDYTLKRPVAIVAEVPALENEIPEHLQRLNPVVVGISADGRHYSLLTTDSTLVSGSVKPGGFYLEQHIVAREMVQCTLLENGLTALHERNGTVHLYDMNTYATRELPMPGTAMGVCAAEGTESFYGLVNAGGKLGVFVVPVWKRWDTPFRLLAHVKKGSIPSWEDFAHAVQEGRDSPLSTVRSRGSLELVWKTDGQPVLDSRCLPKEIKNCALSVDGTKLALVGTDGRFRVMNLSAQLENYPVELTPVHFVSKGGKHEWPFQSLKNASTNLQQALTVVSDGDSVVVDDGTYSIDQEIQLRDRADITLRSRNGRNACRLVSKSPTRALRFIRNTGCSTVKGFSFEMDESIVVGSGLEFLSVESVVVADCSFSGFKSDHSGAGLSIITKLGAPSNQVYVSNCIASNNQALKKGGGMGIILNSRDGFARVENSILTGNRSRKQGGGLNFQSTGALGRMEVLGCLLSENTTTHSGGSGGGLNLTCNAVNGGMWVSNSVFTGNHSLDASGGGASVTHHGKGGILEVADCVLSNNTAKLLGGGLSTTGHHVDTFIHGCRMEKNAALTGGGVISQSDNGFALIDRCEVVGNQAVSYGGGVGGHRVFPQFKTNRIVSNCLIANNRSEYQGGGVRDRILVNCTITGNTAELGGGASFSILKNCTIEGNTAARHSNYYKSLIVPASSNHLDSILIDAFTNRPEFFKLDALKYKTHHAPPGYISSP